MTEIHNETTIGETARDIQSRRESAESALYNSDGRQIYSDAEHAERLQQLKEERDQRAAELTEQADKLVEKRQAELAALEDADPIVSLSESELSKANGLRAFIREDAEESSLQDLARRAKAASLSGDGVTALLYSRYVSRRHARDLQAMREANDTGIQSGVDVEALNSVKGVADELAEQTAPRGVAKARLNLQKAQMAQRSANSSRLTDRERREQSNLADMKL